MTVKCSKCKGTNVLQEASIMLNPNNPEATGVEFGSIALDNLMWEDYFYCDDCKDETQVEEDG